MKFVPEHCIPKPATPFIPATETENAVPAQPAYQPSYTGYVMIEMPDYETVQEIYENIEIDRHDGETDEELQKRLISDPSTRRKSLQLAMRAARRRLPEHVKEIALTRVEDGFVFTAWDQLIKETGAFPIISELVNKFLGQNKFGASDPS